MTMRPRFTAGRGLPATAPPGGSGDLSVACALTLRFGAEHRVATEWYAAPPHALGGDDIDRNHPAGDSSNAETIHSSDWLTPCPALA
jgi:hypothetical protein